MIMPCKECKRQETCDDSGHCDRYIRAKKQREKEKNLKEQVKVTNTRENGS